jgi:DNA invertase Pin-like site-specific DNA recombinase
VRASIYARISSDREGAGLGVQTQEHDCRELAEKFGWSIVAVHTDNDVSAYSGKPRPGYRALLDDIRAGRAQAVLAWHTDRLHRSVTELEEYASLCDTHGVTTHTVKAGEIDLATPSGRLVARQLGAVARYEVEHMVERQRRAKLRSATAGKWKGGRRPFGYLSDGITVEPTEADAVRAAAAAILAGASLRGVARDWNAQGLVTAGGGVVDANAVRRILLRPRNAGLMEHQGEIVGKAEWEAIIPEGEWRAVVRRISDPARRTTPGPARKWLGSGLYRCGVCGSGLIATTVNRRRGYRCRASHVTRTLDDLDNYVKAVISERLRQPDAADLLAKQSTVDVAPLELEAVTLRARLDELAGMFAEGTIDAQQLTEGTRTLHVALDGVRAAIADAYRGTAVSGVAEAPDPAAAWLDAPLDRQRAVLAALATVIVNKGAGGRPKGWKVGENYFRVDLIDIEWRSP